MGAGKIKKSINSLNVYKKMPPITREHFAY